MRTRFAKRLKAGAVLEQYWYDNLGCRHHKASSEFLDDPLDTWDAEDYEEWRWESKCDSCGVPAPRNAAKRVKPTSLYNTPTGGLEPGSLYWCTNYPDDYFWDNHKGPYLGLVAPNGFHWIIDSRAKNCKSPMDQRHRCWRWIGDPEVGNITIVQDHTTCSPDPLPVIRLGSWSGRVEDGTFYELNAVEEDIQHQQLFI